MQTAVQMSLQFCPWSKNYVDETTHWLQQESFSQTILEISSFIVLSSIKDWNSGLQIWIYFDRHWPEVYGAVQGELSLT